MSQLALCQEERDAYRDERDRLEAVNAKLLEALEGVEREADYDGCNSCRYIHSLARNVIEEARK